MNYKKSAFYAAKRNKTLISSDLFEWTDRILIANTALYMSSCCKKTVGAKIIGPFKRIMKYWATKYR